VKTAYQQIVYASQIIGKKNPSWKEVFGVLVVWYKEARLLAEKRGLPKPRRPRISSLRVAYNEFRKAPSSRWL